MRPGLTAIMRKLATNEHNIVERPSRFLGKLRSFIRSVQEMSAHVELGLDQMLREIMFEEFYEEGIAQVGKPTSFAPLEDAGGVTKTSTSETGGSGKPSKTCGNMYWKFYSSQFLDWVMRGGIVYSELSLGFVSRGRSATQHRSSRSPRGGGKSSGSDPVILAQDYTDIRELRDFCTFAGPHGVLALERRHILALVAKNAANIKAVLVKNEVTLKYYVQRRMAQATV